MTTDVSTGLGFQDSDRSAKLRRFSKPSTLLNNAIHGVHCLSSNDNDVQEALTRGFVIFLRLLIGIYPFSFLGKECEA
jgi:adenylylsulfate kinase-like enzyme